MQVQLTMTAIQDYFYEALNFTPHVQRPIFTAKLRELGPFLSGQRSPRAVTSIDLGLNPCGDRSESRGMHV